MAWWTVLHTLRPSAAILTLHKPSVSFFTVERPSRMSCSSAWNFRLLAADILLVVNGMLHCCGDRCAPCLDSTWSLVAVLVGGAAQISHRVQEHAWSIPCQKQPCSFEAPLKVFF